MTATITLNINWSHLSPQFEEMMQHSQYSLPEIRESLNNMNFTETIPFENETFWYEGSTFTLTQLGNLVELLIGDDREFIEVMRQKVITVADKLLSEYNEEITAQEGQRELVWSLNRAIDRRESA